MTDGRRRERQSPSPVLKINTRSRDRPSTTTRVGFQYPSALWRNTKSKMSKKSPVTREREKAIRAAIDASTIPEELKVLYLMANATELMSTQAFMRLKKVFASHGYTISENELLTGITQYCKMVKMATYQFFERIEPQIMNATFSAGRYEDDTTGNAAAYDGFNEDTNEICRLVLLYIDRTARSKEGFAKVFKTLRQLPSAGIINDEDIAKYKMREL